MEQSWCTHSDLPALDPKAVAVALFVLYRLSFGPAAWWAGASNDRWQTVDTVYAPLDWLETHFEPLGNAMGWYLDKLHNLRR
jgi:hypothetical protein